jgi:transposase
MIKLWKRGKSKSPEMEQCKVFLKGICMHFKDSSNKQVRNLCKLILGSWEAVIYFTEVEGIEPTNNIAERFLRMLVISRKISFGSQSEQGMLTTGRLRTVTGTCKMRGINTWDYLTEVVSAHRRGIPVPGILGRV